MSSRITPAHITSESASQQPTKEVPLQAASAESAHGTPTLLPVDLMLKVFEHLSALKELIVLRLVNR